MISFGVTHTAAQAWLCLPALQTAPVHGQEPRKATVFTAVHMVVVESPGTDKRQHTHIATMWMADCALPQRTQN